MSGLACSSCVAPPGQKVDVEDGSHWTPLQRVAALRGIAKVAKILIDAGADVNRRDSSQTTVLMVSDCMMKFLELTMVAGMWFNLMVKFVSLSLSVASCFEWSQGFGQASPQKWSQSSD